GRKPHCLPASSRCLRFTLSVQFDAGCAAPKEANVIFPAQLPSKNAGDFRIAVMKILEFGVLPVQTQTCAVRIAIARFGIEDISALRTYDDIPTHADVLTVIHARICD